MKNQGVVADEMSWRGCMMEASGGVHDGLREEVKRRGHVEMDRDDATVGCVTGGRTTELKKVELKVGRLEGEEAGNFDLVEVLVKKVDLM